MPEATSNARRQFLRSFASVLGAAGMSAWVDNRLQAQTATTPFPYYRGEDALHGIYEVHMPVLAAQFESRARELAHAAAHHCWSSDPVALRSAWRQTRTAWVALSTPALGPVITRRSQRQIDFWPMRPALLQRTLNAAPSTLGEMTRVGGPAKGFPALEHLMDRQPSERHCTYVALLAQDIQAEAIALRQGFENLARQSWSADEAASQQAFSEWINQWLGGLEYLRWRQIEQPIQRAITTGVPLEFARRRMEDNLQDWRAQWSALMAQARLHPMHPTQPPVAGSQLVPIEALLMGKGQIALARQWAQTLDAISVGLSLVDEDSSTAVLMELSGRMKAATVLYQSKVASALDVPLGFSNADGD